MRKQQGEKMGRRAAETCVGWNWKKEMERGCISSSALQCTRTMNAASGELLVSNATGRLKLGE